MQTNATTFAGKTLAAIALGILASIIVVGLLANVRLTVLGSDRVAFIALLIVGMTRSRCWACHSSCCLRRP